MTAFDNLMGEFRAVTDLATGPVDRGIFAVFATEEDESDFAYTMIPPDGQTGLFVSGACDGGANNEMCAFGLGLLILKKGGSVETGDAIVVPTSNPEVWLRFKATDAIRPKEDVEAFQSLVENVRIVEIEVVRDVTDVPDWARDA